MNRTCPACEHDALCSPQEARAVFQTNKWGAHALLDDAQRVCSWCKAVDMGDGWQRLQSRRERAYELSQDEAALGDLPGTDGVDETNGEW